MSRVEGAMSRVEGTMSRVQKYFKIIIKLFLKRRIIKLSKANFVFDFRVSVERACKFSRKWHSTTAEKSVGRWEI